MAAERAKVVFDQFVMGVRGCFPTPQQGAEKVKTGVFGAYMHVNTVVDGPVNIILDSKTK